MLQWCIKLLTQELFACIACALSHVCDDEKLANCCYDIVRIVRKVLSIVCVLCTVPNDKRHVIVQKLAIVAEGHADIEVDLTGC